MPAAVPAAVFEPPEPALSAALSPGDVFAAEGGAAVPSSTPPTHTNEGEAGLRDGSTGVGGPSTPCSLVPGTRLDVIGASGDGGPDDAIETAGNHREPIEKSPLLCRTWKTPALRILGGLESIHFLFLPDFLPFAGVIWSSD